MFMLMRILKCSSSWTLNKDRLGTLQTYKTYIGNSLDLNPLGGSPSQVSFPSLHLGKYNLCNLACFLSYKWKIGYEAYTEVCHRICAVSFVSINGDYMYESQHLDVTYSVTSYQAVSLPGAVCMKFKQQILSCCVGNEKP